MCPNQQETADLVTFTEEILNGKLYFSCSAFSAKPYVILAYLEPWHIRNPRHIQNIVKHLS